MVRNARKRTGTAAAVALSAVFLTTESHAVPGAAAGWLGDAAPIAIAMSAIDLVNLGTVVANIVYLGDSEMPKKVAVLSYLGGAAGLVAGGLGAARSEPGVQALGAASFGLAALSIGLTTWNLTRPTQEERRPALVMAPSTMVDSSGASVPAAAVAGVF
jgi:hypothetical protein